MRFYGTFVTVDRNDAGCVKKLLRHSTATVTQLSPHAAALKLEEVNYGFTAESYCRALGVIDRPETDFANVLDFCEMLDVDAQPCELELPDDGWKIVYKGRDDLYETVAKLRKKPDPKFELIECSGRRVTIKSIE